MVVTPTYYVFEMYKPFKDAAYLPLQISTPAYKHGRFTVPAIHGAAARGADGKVYVALSNLNPNDTAKLTVKLEGLNARSVSGQILTATAMNAINTFENPDAVKPTGFVGARVKGNELSVELPSKSVVVLTLQ